MIPKIVKIGQHQKTLIKRKSIWNRKFWFCWEWKTYAKASLTFSFWLIMKITELNFDSNTTALVHSGHHHSMRNWHQIHQRRRFNSTDMLKQLHAFGVEKNICFSNRSFQQNQTNSRARHSNPSTIPMAQNSSSPLPPLKFEAKPPNPVFDPHGLDSNLLEKIAYDALVWSSLRGLLVGDRASQVCFDWASQNLILLFGCRFSTWFGDIDWIGGIRWFLCLSWKKECFFFCLYFVVSSFISL